MKAYKNMDEYIKDFPKETQQILKKIKATIKKEVPEPEEAIRYAIPTIRFKGKNLVHFAAFKDHYSFFPGSEAVDEFMQDLFPYQISKGTIQFQLHEKIPYDLIKKITKFRVKKVLEKVKKK